MTDQDLKITDKRMFTPDGELREEFRHLEDSRSSEEKPAGEGPPDDGNGEPGSVPPATSTPEAQTRATETSAPQTSAPQTSAPQTSAPQTSAPQTSAAGPRAPEAPVSEPPRGERPSAAPPGATRKVVFEDLVGLLAEHAAIALGDAPLPDGESMLDLTVAQMYIDLLDVLREKTSGNLTEQQTGLLEELLYRLRLVYVEKSREKG